MARIALGKIRVDRSLLHRQAGRLPGLGATIDRGKIAIALRLQEFRRQPRTLTALADQQDCGIGIGIGKMRGRIGLQVLAGDAARAFGHAERAFAIAAYIDQDRAGLLACAGLACCQVANGHVAIIADAGR